MSVNSDVTIRPLREDDAAGCAQLFFDVVREGTGAFYDEDQRRVWAPTKWTPEAFLQKVAGQFVVVAEDARGIAGFMTLRGDYLDFAYVRTDRLGQGVAGELYNAIVEEARRTGQGTLRSDASELAKRFFAKRGWTTHARRDFERHGVMIHNYAMSVTLAD